MPRVAWREEFVRQCHMLARNGCSRSQMSKALGVDEGTMKRWVKTKPDLALAIRLGRGEIVKVPPRVGEGALKRTVDDGTTFIDMTYGRLSPAARKLWRKIERIDESEVLSDGKKDRLLDKVLRGETDEVRQMLWVHALICSCWDSNEACRKTGTSWETLRRWKLVPAFHELLETVVKECRKDFIESSLFNLIRQGDVTATLFAAKCLMKDRGYDPKTTVKLEGVLGVGHVNMDQILDELPPEVKEQMLRNAMSKMKALPEHKGG